MMVSYQLVHHGSGGLVILEGFGYYLASFCDRNVSVEVGDV